MFRQDFMCPALLERQIILHIRGCHPLWPDFPVCSACVTARPGPRSLATTNGVSVDVLSSGYLDVSVHRVCLLLLCIRCRIPLRVGCPIRKSAHQRLLAPPRSLSQRATSFIASWFQGIHQMPFSCLRFTHVQKKVAHI